MNTNNNNNSMVVNVSTGEILAAPDVEPVVWSDFARQIGLRGTPISAKELVGTTFDILRAKPFESSFKEGEHAWYCVVRPVDQAELFSVVIDGGAVVEILDAFARSMPEAPLRVKLAWKDGGKFSGYYYLE